MPLTTPTGQVSTIGTAWPPHRSIQQIQQYDGSVKIKTSVTLSADLLEAVDARIGPAASRSEFIEMAVRGYLASLVRREHDARDLEIMNRYANEMNAEASDLLDYQAGS